MPYGVMLYFDVHTEKTIYDIWQILAEQNLSSGMLDAGIRPHITLAIYEELECKPCENELLKITSKTSSLSIQLTHLGLFTNPDPVIFAAPLATKSLLDFHSDLQVKLADDGKNSWDLYKPGNWVPHCTLAMGYQLQHQAEIIRLCQALPFPMHVHAVQMGVVNFKPVKNLFNCDFSKF